MTMIMSARRREAEDLQRLLDGDRTSSPRAAQDLAPLLELARGLSPTAVTPSADFRTALRERLVTEAAARVPAPAVPAQRARPSAPSRLKQAVAAVAVTSVVAGAGAAMASTRALPGDSLYGLKRQIENVQLDIARGDIGNGRELLQQADARLSEAEALTAGEHGSDPESVARVSQALTEMDAAVTLAAEHLSRAYRETGDEEPLILLDRFVTEQRERLDDLMLVLDPSLRERAADLARRLAVLDAQLSAWLGTSLGDSASAIAHRAMLDSGDGWAVGRRIDRAGSTATGTGAATRATGTGVEDVLDAVGGVTGGSGGGATIAVGGGSRGGNDTGVVGGVLGGGTSTSTGLPSIAPTAVPTVSVPPVPAPTSTPRVSVPAVPLPTVTSVPVVPSVAPSVPSVSVPPASVCVPVPPLSTC